MPRPGLALGPREHRVFMGAFDPNGAPKSLPERFLRLMPRSDQILPAGDFREWPAIEAWAREIAGALSPARAPSPARTLSPARALSPARTLSPARALSPALAAR